MSQTLENQRSQLPYEARKAQLISDEFDLQQLSVGPVRWLNSRPAILRHNRDFRVNSEKIIPGEILEVKWELEKRVRNLKALHTETVDVFFCALNFAWTQGIELDPHRITSRLNGSGQRSDALDVMESIIANATKASLDRDLHEFFRKLVAFTASLSEFDLLQTMKEVTEKNKANYPRHHFQEDFLGPRRKLKLIRNAHRDILHEDDRDYGLLITDWLPYDHLITEHQDDERAFTQLTIALCQDLHLTPPQSASLLEPFHVDYTYAQ